MGKLNWVVRIEKNIRNPLRDLICIKTSRLKKKCLTRVKTVRPELYHSHSNNKIWVGTNASDFGGKKEFELKTYSSTILPNLVSDFIWSRLTFFNAIIFLPDAIFAGWGNLPNFRLVFPNFHPFFLTLFLHLLPLVSPRPKHVQTPRKLPSSTTQFGSTHLYTFIRRSADFGKKTCFWGLKGTQQGPVNKAKNVSWIPKKHPIVKKILRNGYLSELWVARGSCGPPCHLSPILLCWREATFFNYHIVHGLAPPPFFDRDSLECWCLRHETAWSVRA